MNLKALRQSAKTAFLTDVAAADTDMALKQALGKDPVLRHC